MKISMISKKNWRVGECIVYIIFKQKIFTKLWLSFIFNVNEAIFYQAVVNNAYELLCVFRAEEALRLVNYKEPSMTAVERAEAEELKKMNIKIHGMKIRLEQLKKKSIQQIKHADAFESSEKRKEIVFTHSQEKVIQETLSQM